MKSKTRKKIALFEAVLMIVSTIAFAFIISGGIVSAESAPTLPTKLAQTANQVKYYFLASATTYNNINYPAGNYYVEISGSQNIVYRWSSTSNEWKRIGNEPGILSAFGKTGTEITKKDIENARIAAQKQPSPSSATDITGSPTVPGATGAEETTGGDAVPMSLKGGDIVKIDGKYYEVPEGLVIADYYDTPNVIKQLKEAIAAGDLDPLPALPEEASASLIVEGEDLWNGENENYYFDLKDPSSGGFNAGDLAKDKATGKVEQFDGTNWVESTGETVPEGGTEIGAQPSEKLPAQVAETTKTIASLQKQIDEKRALLKTVKDVEERTKILGDIENLEKELDAKQKSLASYYGSSELSQKLGLTPGTASDVIVSGLEWATLALVASKTLGQFVKWVDKDWGKGQQEALDKALSAGAFTYKTLSIMQKSGGTYSGFLSSMETGGSLGKIGSSILSPTGLALIVTAAVFILTYEEKKTKLETLEFRCMTWQAPNGGADCYKCNEDENKPCSEYRCKSLGQTCGIINPGTTQEQCIDMSRDDVSSPGIKPLEEEITNGYIYKEVVNMPPGESSKTAGMRITTANGGCVDAFTPISFGVETFDADNLGEPAQCKFDINHTAKYDDMAYYLGDSELYVINHTQTLYLPSPNVVSSIYPEIQNDGVYTWYIRCKDGNGNANLAEFALRFCVDAGPDLTPPQIKSTSITNNAPVPYQVDNVSLNIYIDEPGACKWDRAATEYDYMNYNFSCSSSITEINAEATYGCSTTLTAIQDMQDNNFYFRCKDLSNNTMHQAYPFTLKGTEPLSIIDIKPNGTVGGSTSTVLVNLSVTTDNGYNNGDAICYFSTSNESITTEFFETESNRHKQTLELTEENYTYYIKCVDLGGNTAYNYTNFSVSVDKSPPQVLRAYYEGQKVKILTNEESECRYSSSSCNFDFEDGIDMPFGGTKEHYAEWITSQAYYIKCQDKYRNLPAPTACSIILRPFTSPSETV